MEYPEELPGFQLPESYNTALNEHHHEEKLDGPSRSNSEGSPEKISEQEKLDMPEFKQRVTTRIIRPDDLELQATLTRAKLGESTMPYTEERSEVEAELAADRTVN